MPTETELKLTLDPKHASLVARVPALQEFATAKSATQTLRSIYFDTPEDDLRRSGIALRVRRMGRTWIQTLKSGGSVNAGLHVREESEHRVAGPELDLGRIADSSLRKRLRKWQAAAGIEPRFETSTRRTTWNLGMPDGSLVECALDRGEVRTPQGRSAVALCEVELELKAGDPTTLFRLARDLAQSVPLALEDRSKADRGYALLHRESATKPSKAEPLVLPPEPTAGVALAQIIGNGIRHLHRNWEAARAAFRYDLEHVHQMRVASRRLRTAFVLFGRLDPEIARSPLVEELRWLAAALGEARNWDIMLANTLPRLLAAFPDEPALRTLARTAGLQRRRARQAAQDALRSPRYFALMLDLTEFSGSVAQRAALAQPAEEFAAAVLTRRDKQLRKRARKLAQLSGPERHAVRIAAKKLRYAAEFFAPLFAGHKLEVFVRRFNALQDALGLLNDLATAQALIAALPARPDAAAQHARGLLRGWCAGMEEGSLSEVVRLWARVKRAEPFWPETDQAPSSGNG